MQRRSNSKITSSKLDDEDGFVDDDPKSKRLTHHNGRGGSKIQSSSNIIPKSLVGTLLIVGLIAIFICISKLASPSSSSSRGGGETGGTRSIRSVKNDIVLKNDIVQPAVSSSSSSSNRVAKIINGDDVGLTSPTTNATLHVIFSTDCKFSLTHTFHTS